MHLAIQASPLRAPKTMQNEVSSPILGFVVVLFLAIILVPVAKLAAVAEQDLIRLHKAPKRLEIWLGPNKKGLDMGSIGPKSRIQPPKWSPKAVRPYHPSYPGRAPPHPPSCAKIYGLQMLSRLGSPAARPISLSPTHHGACLTDLEKAI